MSRASRAVVNSCAVSETRSPRHRLRAFALVAMLLLAFGVTACGGDGDDGGGGNGGGTNTGTAATTAERAFLEAMVPHHKSAISMAEVAVDRAEEPEIKRLAQAILKAQDPEIQQMGRIHERVFNAGLRPNVDSHEALGLTAEEAGMGHEDSARELRTADPFDRAFVDEMVPHHRGAIKMAEAVLKKTADAELRKLAQAIIDAQMREVERMNAFRTEHYGGPVPETDASSGEDGHGEDEGH
jgi:uncharacterized protein (DUF305 family)